MAVGKIDSIIDFLSDIAHVPDDLKNRISSIQSHGSLTVLNKKAARVVTYINARIRD